MQRFSVLLPDGWEVQYMLEDFLARKGLFQSMNPSIAPCGSKILHAGTLDLQGNHAHLVAFLEQSTHSIVSFYSQILRRSKNPNPSEKTSKLESNTSEINVDKMKKLARAAVLQCHRHLQIGRLLDGSLSSSRASNEANELRNLIYSSQSML